MITFYLITSFLTHIFIYAYYAIFNVQLRQQRVLTLIYPQCLSTEKRIAKYLLIQVSVIKAERQAFDNFIDLDLGVFSVGLVVQIYSGGQNSSFRSKSLA